MRSGLPLNQTLRSEALFMNCLLGAQISSMLLDNYRRLIMQIYSAKPGDYTHKSPHTRRHCPKRFNFLIYVAVKSARLHFHADSWTSAEKVNIKPTREMRPIIIASVSFSFLSSRTFNTCTILRAMNNSLMISGHRFRLRVWWSFVLSCGRLMKHSIILRCKKNNLF